METEEREVWENLAEWDNLENPLAPLTDEQQKTILELAALCDHKLSVEDVSLSKHNKISYSAEFQTCLIIQQETNESKGTVISRANDTKPDTTILDSFASLKSGEKTIDSSQQVSFKAIVCDLITKLIVYILVCSSFINGILS